MKKKFLLLVLLSFMLIGCAEREVKPIDWDVSQNNDWEIWATGEISEIKVVKGNNCGHKNPIPDADCSSYYRNRKSASAVSDAIALASASTYSGCQKSGWDRRGTPLAHARHAMCPA